MTNNTEDRKKQLANVDTAMMWLGDAQTWMDMAERLDNESKQEQNADPTNHHKQSVAQACTGLAFELAYKSLLVAEFKMPEETHSVEKLHKRLKVETQRVVEEWVKEAGWEESDDLLKFLDKYMAHPDIKYQLDNPWEKEKRDPGFTLTGMGTIPELAKILYQLAGLGEQNLAEARNITPNQLNPQDALNAILEIIREIAEKSVDGDYIYRGEPKYHDKVSSTLYRQYEDNIEAEHFEIEVAQGEMLKEAKDYMHETDEEFEILTQLQHYGGKTNLIDFTTDYLIALFFACNGFFEEPGRVILLREGIQRENRVEKPRSVINRVRDQKSIFARPPKGFIEIESDDAINIPEWLKRPMLKHLEKYHDISTKTIYNDLHGFIRVQDLHQSAYTEFYKGWTCQDKKQHDKAIEHYTEALKRNPQLVMAYNNRSNIYKSRGEHDRAIVGFTRAIQLKPDYVEAYNNRGNAYREQGNYDRAIADLTKAIDLNPNYAIAYNNRGVSYQDKNEYNLAIADFDVAIQLEPDDAEAYSNRGGVYGKAGDYDRAIKDLNTAIHLKPDHTDAYNNRGVVYEKKGEIDRAIGDYTIAIDLKPDYAEAYNNRGSAYDKKGDYNRAVDDFAKVILLKPDSADAYYNHGSACIKRGDYDRAIESLSTAIHLKSDYAEAYSNRGSAYSYKNEYDLAVENYTKAIQFNANYAEAYCGRGAAYVNKGDIDGAMGEYTKAIQCNANYAEAYFGLGAAYHVKGDFDHAISNYNKAIDLKSDYANAYNNRGAAYSDRGEVDRAIDEYNTAVTLKPDYVEAYYNRGNAYFKKGDYNRAISNYTEAIDLNPNYAIAYYNRGRMWLHLRNWEKAKSELTAARDMGINIIAAFHSDYGGVAGFQQMTGIQLPADLAAMLTPQQ